MNPPGTEKGRSFCPGFTETKGTPLFLIVLCDPQDDLTDSPVFGAGQADIDRNHAANGGVFDVRRKGGCAA